MSRNISIRQLALGLCTPSSSRHKAQIFISNNTLENPASDTAIFYVYDGAELTIQNLDIRAYFNSEEVGLFRINDRSLTKINASEIYHFNGAESSYSNATFVLRIPAAIYLHWTDYRLFNKRLPLSNPRLLIDSSRILTAGMDYASVIVTWPTLSLDKSEYRDELNISVQNSEILMSGWDGGQLLLEPHGQNVTLISNRFTTCRYEHLNEDYFTQDNFISQFKNSLCTGDTGKEYWGVLGASYGHWNIEGNTFENNWDTVFRSGYGIELDMTGTQNSGNILLNFNGYWCSTNSPFCKIGWSFAEDEITSEAHTPTDYSSSASSSPPYSGWPLILFTIFSLLKI